MKKHDIQVTLTVLAKDEKSAEEYVQTFMRVSKLTVDSPYVLDWEFTEFIPSDLSKSCCC